MLAQTRQRSHLGYQIHSIPTTPELTGRQKLQVQSLKIRITDQAQAHPDLIKDQPLATRANQSQLQTQTRIGTQNPTGGHQWQSQESSKPTNRKKDGILIPNFIYSVQYLQTTSYDISNNCHYNVIKRDVIKITYLAICFHELV